MSSPLRQPMQAAPSSQQSKRQILPPGSISTQDPTSTFGEFRNLTSTEVQYLRAGKKPYFQMTAEEKLNINNQNFIDYPFLKNKSEELEFEYMNKCEYYIGCNSGLWMLALHLKKKCL